MSSNECVEKTQVNGWARVSALAEETYKLPIAYLGYGYVDKLTNLCSYYQMISGNESATIHLNV
jgi:hypothetical protein